MSPTRQSTTHQSTTHQSTTHQSTTRTERTAERLADTAAPLDVLLVDAALGPVRRFTPDMSTASWAWSLARKPRTTARRLGDFGAEAGRIVTGTSTVAPRRSSTSFRCG